MKNLESSLMKRSQNLICKICHNGEERGILEGMFYHYHTVTLEQQVTTPRSSACVCRAGDIKGSTKGPTLHIMVWKAHLTTSDHNQ